jgi:ABC-type dipeptide/oligopeptide/nickel transport system permease component
MREVLHLDAPIYEQFGAFVGTVFDGTLGHSFRRRDLTVASMLGDVLPSTATLGLSAFLVACLLAIPLGTLAAAKRNTRWDTAARTTAMLGLVVPSIWLGPLLILLFGVTLRWLPLPGDDEGGLAGLVLPSVTIGAALAAVLTRQTRGAMLDVLSEQYVLAARARGVSYTKVLFVHALRNALLPVLTVAGAQLGALLSGTVIAEKIFERRGLGSLFLEAFFARDMPVVQGAVLVVAAVYVFVNLGVDLLYGLIDPRVRVA